MEGWAVTDDMVERVAQAMFWGPDTTAWEREKASIAIAIALEEAARVAEIYEYDELEDDGGATIKPSAAIRAMMEKKND